MTSQREEKNADQHIDHPAAEWLLADDDRELLLKVDGKTFATITRWSDRTTGEHSWFGIERHDGYSLGLSEGLPEACRRAVAAANIEISAPQDLIAEWAPEKTAQSTEPAVRLPAPVGKLFGPYAWLSGDREAFESWASSQRAIANNTES